MIDLLCEQRGRARVITLNRPEKRNAMTRDMARRMGELLTEAASDDSVSAVVFTGAGEMYSAGLDRAEIAKGLDEKSEFPVELLVHYPKPTIAAVNGLAFGGAATMVMACDLRIAADSAVLCFGLGAVGLTPEWASSYLLWRQVGYARALEVFLTARRIGSAEALGMGLVNRVVPDAELMPSVDELVESIAALPPGTPEAIKDVLRRGLDATFSEAREHEMRTVARRSRAMAALRRQQG